MRLVVDIDGVLADFNASYARALIKVDGDRLPSGWQDNPDFAPVWDWDLHFGYSPAAIERTWYTHVLTNPKFWSSLTPLEGARETARYLNALSKTNHEVYFLTHRMGVNAKLQTEEWLYDLGLWYPTVVMASAAAKPEILRLIHADFFIDDKLETVEAVKKAKVPLKLYLKDAAYNRSGRTGGYGITGGVADALREVGLWNRTPTKSSS